MTVDIDRFETNHDRHGHAVGDAVLSAVAGRLNGALADSDLLSRYGCDQVMSVEGHPA